jgi:glutathione S-transferase
MASEYSQYGITRYTNETKRLYSVLNERLAKSPYLAGDKYTIADLATFGWVRYAPIALGIDLAEFPALKRWHDEITSREAVQRGLAVPKKMTDEQLLARYRGMKVKMDAMKPTGKV